MQLFASLGWSRPFLFLFFFFFHPQVVVLLLYCTVAELELSNEYRFIVSILLRIVWYWWEVFGGSVDEQAAMHGEDSFVFFQSCYPAPG
jgi:hypothetical protein